MGRRIEGDFHPEFGRPISEILKGAERKKRSVLVYGIYDVVDVNGEDWVVASMSRKKLVKLVRESGFAGDDVQFIEYHLRGMLEQGVFEDWDRSSEGGLKEGVEELRKKVVGRLLDDLDNPILARRFINEFGGDPEKLKDWPAFVTKCKEALEAGRLREKIEVI